MRLARAQDQALGMSPELTSRVANEYKYLQRKCTELAVVHHSSAELGADHGVGGQVLDPHRGAARPALRCCSTWTSYGICSGMLSAAHTCCSSSMSVLEAAFRR